MRRHRYSLQTSALQLSSAPALRLSALLLLVAALSFATPVQADVIVTNNNDDDRWAANNTTNVNGHLLWFRNVNGDPRDVWYYDGTSAIMIQAHDPNIASLGLIGETVFALGSGTSSNEVVGAWRRGANYAWVWTSGQSPVEIDTVAANLFDDPGNPQPTNPEGVAVADGCVFMILQANAGGGVLPNHVFKIDPSNGGVQTVSGAATVNGVDEVRTSGCSAAWIFDPNDGNTITGLPLELQYYDGSTTVTLDSGPINWSEIDFRDGKVVYVKDVLERPQIFMVDVAQATPEPQRLSHGLRIKRNPQVDGSHVAWVELNSFGDTTADVVLFGDHVLTHIAARAEVAGPYPFWLDEGQLVWRAANGELRLFIDNELIYSDVTGNHPRISQGKIAWYGSGNGASGNDDEIFVNLDTMPTSGDPAPPIYLDAEAGNGRVTLRWDEVLGATGYNIYYAEVPGVNSSNYGALLGGGTLQDVQSPSVVGGLDNSKQYYFTVTTNDGGQEGPDSGEATPRAVYVDSTIDAPDADLDDGLCLSTVGGCTLRAALGHSSEVDDDRTIVLPGGTYHLTLGPAYALNISDDMRIVGDGQGVSVISGDASDQVIQTAQTQNFGRLILRDLTIRDGIQGIHGHFDLLLDRVTLENNGTPSSSWRGGGGEMMGLNVTLLDCLVANNQSGSHGGGMLLGGWPMQTLARVERTEFRDNWGGLGGGGLYNITANVHLIDSSVHHNSEQDFGGGGVWNEDQMTIVGGAIYSNSTPNRGGGVRSVDTLTIINSTISENHADDVGGGIAGGPRLNLRNVTVIDNTTSQAGGASLRAEVGAQMSFRHTVFANSAGKSNCNYDQPVDTSDGYNLEDGNSCRFVEATDTVNTDPLLGALADNGGPSLSHMPLPGSPALDAGDPAGCDDAFGMELATDQRGMARPHDGGSGPWCDLGAVESLGPCTDFDGDSFESGLDPSCQLGPNADCNDADNSVYPGAPPVCDGLNNDCASLTWPALSGTNEVDGDGDGLSTCAGDCLDTNAAVWGLPGEAHDLRFQDGTTLSWSGPLDPGAAPATLRYDAIRADSADDLSQGGICLQSDQPGLDTTDTDTPGPNQVFFYLSRARNACPTSVGSWGESSAGNERAANACP